jgi:hypothetical protein
MFRSKLSLIPRGQPMKVIKLAPALLILAATHVFATGPSKLSADQNRVLESARASALQYAHNLPNLVCRQIAHRNNLKSNHSFNVYAGGMAMIEPDSHEIVEEQLTFAGGKETRAVLAVDGKKASSAGHTQPDDASPRGEFGTFFFQVFDPESHADFAWEREVHVRGRLGWSFNYRVTNEYGTPVINQLTSATLMAAYSGKVVIDPESKDILEISSTFELPDKFPIQNVKRRVVYADQEIDGRKYCLPVRSESHMETNTRIFDNQIDFKDYHQFASETTPHFDSDSPH